MPIISELTKNELFDIADAEIARMLPLLDTLQNQYKTEDVTEEIGTDDDGKPITRTYKRNRYFQGLQTPAAVPPDGKVTTVDKTRKPTDQVESWADVGAPLPVTSTISYRIDVYDGPSGQGYVVTIIFVSGKETWERSVNVGPEAYREKGWTLIDDMEIS